MFNPFLKRASEHLHDDEAFLATVSPGPVLAYFAPRASALFDRLVIVSGTPGSGKTTFAKLLRVHTLATLNRLFRLTEHRPLLDAMTQIGAIQNGEVSIAGCHLPMDSRYREIWELPYGAEIRNAFLVRLIQARAVQEWIAGFVAAGIELDRITVVRRAAGLATMEAAGGPDLPGLLERAQSVESTVYGITRALVPPDEADIPSEDFEGYDPFHGIDAFRYSPEGRDPWTIKPLVMLDDAHDLHPSQYEFVEKWLRQREIGPARWIMTRLDVLGSDDVLAVEDDLADARPGFEASREITTIRLQGGRKTRGAERSEFRTMALDISRRALSQLETFNRKQLVNLSSLLEARLPELSQVEQSELEAEIERLRTEHNISTVRIASIRKSVEDFGREKVDITAGVKLQASIILVHRYAGRTQTSLFEDEDPEPSRELNLSSDLFDGARLQLMHKYGTPFYFGFPDLADSSWENAQQFLSLASALVDAIETKLIRDRGYLLGAQEQNKILRRVGRSLVDEWSFPLHREVRRLTDWIATEAVARTLQPSAPLSAGANAVGIPQEEFDQFRSSSDKQLNVLKYAVAYNAISVLSNKSVKGRLWTVFELGGPLVLLHGLPLRRGGFVSKTLKDFRLALEKSE